MIIIVKIKMDMNIQLHVQQSIDVTTIPSNNDSNKLFTNTFRSWFKNTLFRRVNSFDRLL